MDECSTDPCINGDCTVCELYHCNYTHTLLFTDGSKLHVTIQFKLALKLLIVFVVLTMESCFIAATKHDHPQPI